MDEFTVGPDEHFCLNLLRRKWREHGFRGQCIVRFHAVHEHDAYDLPFFVRVNHYSFSKPVDDREIGGCERFHLVPLDPLSDFIR